MYGGVEHLLFADRPRKPLGAAGPTGNPYGDAAGHTCIAVAGPLEKAITLETTSADREGNMRAFATASLQLLLQCLSGDARR